MIPPDDHPPVPGDAAPGGVDLTLIDWMLSLTPAERLEALQDFINGVLELRDPHGSS